MQLPKMISNGHGGVSDPGFAFIVLLIYAEDLVVNWILCELKET